MLHTVEWLPDDDAVLLFIFRKDWTWQEVNQAVQTAYKMIDDSDFPLVDSIIDLTQARQRVPDGFIIEGAKLLKIIHPRTGIVILIGASQFVLMGWQALSRMYPDLAPPVFFSEDTTTARQMIRDYRHQNRPDESSGDN